MRRSFLVVFLSLPILLGQTGCIIDLFVDPLGRKAALNESQRQYTKHVRWGDIEAASEYVHPDIREEFLGLEKRFDQVRITEFDVGAVKYQGEKNENATVRVTYHAYSMATFLEKEIRETQQWEREGNTTWWVRPDLEGITAKVAEIQPGSLPGHR